MCKGALFVCYCPYCKGGILRSEAEINKEIADLKDQLENVKGTETEVYTRIVGYYRTIKAWNNGKREEYNYRLPFNVEKSLKNKNLKPIEAIKV